MKKSVLIRLIIIVVGIVLAILTFSFLDQKPTQDIMGRDFGTNGVYSFEKEITCCDDCLNHGDYNDSKNCLEVIQENGGIKYCFMIFEEYPHTYAQCKQLVIK